MSAGAGVFLALLLATGQGGYAEDLEQNKAVVRRLYDELFSKWNFAVVDEVISPEFVARDMPPAMPRGPEAFRQFYGGIRAGLPDVQLTVEDMIAEKDKVVVRWRARATHKGPFLGIPPTGKAVSFTGIAIYRLSKGKIVERWVEVGLLGLTEQLKATSQPASPGPESLVDGFVRAFNTHDAVAFGRLFLEDADWVSVAGIRVRGRAHIQAEHDEAFKTFFSAATLAATGSDVRLIHPDVAVVHFAWELTGQPDREGKPLGPRRGIITIVATKQADGWRISAGQNTNTFQPS